MKIDKHQLKYKIVKFLLKEKILGSFKRNTFIHIQEDFELRKGFIISIYVEDLKNKVINAYSIKNSSLNLERNRKEFEEINKQLVTFDFIKEQRYIEINLKYCPDKISDINNWLDTYVF